MIKEFFIFTAITAYVIINISCNKVKENTSENIIKDINQIREGSYFVNSIDSEVMWKGKQLSTKEHFGTIDILNGNISINKEGIVKGSVDLDMTTIDTKDLEGQWKNKLDGHLKSTDFFDVSTYPNATLNFKGIKNNSVEGNYKFDGDLTIKGITHPISFYSKIEYVNEILLAKSKIIFDRSLYNVKFGSGKFFQNLGDKLIFDDIEIEVLLKTKQRN